ncbi:MAG: permease-like cell division protein FtsX [Calditrichota bacterium]
MFLFILKEGWRNFRSLGLYGLLSLLSLTILLTLVGLAARGYLVIESWRAGMLGRFEIEAFLNPDISEAQVQRMTGSIRQWQEVQTVTYISQAAAAERFRQLFDRDVIDLLGANPLPPSLILTLKKSADPASAWERIANSLKKISGVEEVVYQGEMLADLNRFFRSAWRTAAGATAGVLFFSFFFTILTVAGQIKSREEFIRVVVLSGGRRWLAQGPFVLMGVYYGLLSGLMALGLVVCFGFIIEAGWSIEVSLPSEWIPAFPILGILIAVLGSAWTAGRKIKMY